MTARLPRFLLLALAPASLSLAACGGSETPEANANAARSAGEANDNAAAATGYNDSANASEADIANRVAAEAAAMTAAEARGEASATAAINGANAEEARRTDENAQ